MERLRTIYPRYTGPVAFAGPTGLTGVPFRDSTPYQGEDLLLATEHPESFTVRCTRASGPMTGMCLLERTVGQAEITVRFPREWLPEWRAVNEGSDRLIAQLRTAQSQN
jgi:hypothetical protein